MQNTIPYKEETRTLVFLYEISHFLHSPFICTHSVHSPNTLMVTDFLFGFRTLNLSYADLTLSHCNIYLLFVNLVNLVNLATLIIMSRKYFFGFPQNIIFGSKIFRVKIFLKFFWKVLFSTIHAYPVHY